MEREQLRALLQEKQDTDYQAFQYRLIPNAGAVVGVRMPVLHAIANKMVREDWRTWLESAWTESWYEEIMLRALVIARAKMPLAERLTRIRNFVPEIQNWAICDAFCAVLHITERDALWTFLQPYLQSEAEFAARFGAVMLLHNFVTAEDLSRTLSALAEIPAAGYHARMGIAWALSVCGVQFPEQTLCFLETAELEDWTYNKALQKDAGIASLAGSMAAGCVRTEVQNPSRRSAFKCMIILDTMEMDWGKQKRFQCRKALESLFSNISKGIEICMLKIKISHLKNSIRWGYNLGI